MKVEVWSESIDEIFVIIHSTPFHCLQPAIIINLRAHRTSFPNACTRKRVSLKMDVDFVFFFGV